MGGADGCVEGGVGIVEFVVAGRFEGAIEVARDQSLAPMICRRNARNSPAASAIAGIELFSVSEFRYFNFQSPDKIACLLLPRLMSVDP